MKGAQILGEYKRVSCLSKLPGLLQIAHETFIEPEDAIEMVERLKRIWPVVGFQVNVRAKDGRGRASAWTGKFNLPLRNLRAGIVLHEYAHILQQSQGLGGAAHGPTFVRVLDKLLETWYLKLR